jgi:hypothetical protein
LHLTVAYDVEISIRNFNDFRGKCKKGGYTVKSRLAVFEKLVPHFMANKKALEVNTSRAFAWQG